LSPQEWRQVNDLFSAALEMDKGARIAFLHARTAADSAIRDEVESLLVAHEKSEHFLSRPANSLLVKVMRASSSSSKAAELTPGTRLGDFEVLRTLGLGAFAVVYLARQVSLGREVALKVSPDVGEEAKTMASLDHTHIVPVYSETVDAERNLRLICMPYVRGVNLETVIQDLDGRDRTKLTGNDILACLEKFVKDAPAYSPALSKERERMARRPFDEVVARMGLNVAEALAYAHQRGVLHLDIKPANILIDFYGRPYLADFNVAKREAGGVVTHSMPGGTPLYMSPEHQTAFDRGTENSFKTVHEPADIYSLGLVLWELAFGRVPTEGDLIRHDAEATKDLQPDLKEVLRPCLESDLTKRDKSVDALIQRLHAYLDLHRMVQKIPPMGPIMRFSFKHPVFSLIAIPMIPQLIGTVVARTYAYAHTGLQLSPAEKIKMTKLGGIYPMISYPVAIILSLLVIIPIAIRFKKRKSLWDSDSPETLATYRHSSLWMPIWRAAINSLTWLTTIPFFQAISYSMGRFYWKGCIHFSVMIILAWLIATIYSAIYNTYFAVRIFYPRFLAGTPTISDQVRKELSGVERWLKFSPVLTLVIPIVAAMNLIFIGPTEFSPERYRSFQLLLLAVIGSGVAGFLFTLTVTANLARVVAALKGHDPVTTSSD
jgi:eukaryotic-like serine/threonine-protein kinase